MTQAPHSPGWNVQDYWAHWWIESNVTNCRSQCLTIFALCNAKSSMFTAEGRLFMGNCWSNGCEAALTTVSLPHSVSLTGTVSLSQCCDTVPGKVTEEGRACSGSQFNAQTVLMVREAGGEAAGHDAPSASKQGAIGVCAQGTVLPTFKMDSPTSTNLIKRFPWRHVHRLNIVCQMCLEVCITGDSRTW